MTEMMKASADGTNPPAKDDGPPPPQAKSDAHPTTAPYENAKTALGDVGQLAIGETKKGWKAAISIIAKQQTAVGKVNLSNKIGTSAVDLDDSDPLKIITLSSQRAIRAFCQARPSVASDTVEVEPVPEMTSPGVVEFEAENALESSPYSVRQPAFKCTELFNDQFINIRSAFGISERQYYAVLSLQQKRTESSFSVIGAGQASGKSPSFFFLSADQRFILKSCTKRDTATLSNILGGYQDHVQLYKQEKVDWADNSSLLPRYIGLYTFEFEDADVPDVTLVCMTNFFAGAYKIHKKYDLKGSTFHRKASEKERKKKSPVYKDLDWMAEARKLTFPTAEETELVRKQLEMDTAFLRDNNLIDYSLLVGVHEKDGGKTSNHGRKEAMHVVCSTSSTEIRYFGIVDILTPFFLRKRAETLTGMIACRPGISCKPPIFYQRRFMAFCADEILAVE